MQADSGQHASLGRLVIYDEIRLTRNHDEQFHEMVVDGGRGRRLDDEYILISDRRVNLDRSLEREELGDRARCEGNTESNAVSRCARLCVYDLCSEAYTQCF